MYMYMEQVNSTHAVQFDVQYFMRLPCSLLNDSTALRKESVIQLNTILNW